MSLNLILSVRSYIAFIFLIFLFFISCDKRSNSVKTPPKAVNGELDLRDWDFKKDGIVKLEGDWKFYWMQLLLPEQIQQNQGNLTSIVSVPDIWNNYQINDENLAGQAYATYVLNVALPENPGNLVLYLSNSGTAHRLFINGQLAAKNGLVSNDLDKIEGEWRPVYVQLKNDSKYQILIQIANSQDRHGGMWAAMQIGQTEMLQNNRLHASMLEFLLFGSILIMGMYHLGLFYFRRQDKAALYFGLFCILISIRILTTGEHYLQSAFPHSSFAILLKLEYLTMYLGVPLFSLYVFELFHLDFNQRIRNIIKWIGFSASLIIIVLPTLWMTKTLCR